MKSGTAAIFESLRPYRELPAEVKLLCVGTFINRAGAFVFTFLTIYVSRKLGFGTGFAGYCFGVFGIGATISLLVGGQLADAIGRKPVMTLALLGGAIFLALIPFTRDKTTFLLLILAFSLFAEMYRPAASAMIGDLVDAENRPVAFALMYVAMNLGYACAAPIGGFLADVYSFEVLFWGDALTTAIYGLIILLFVRETLPAKTDRAIAGVPTATWIQAARHIQQDTRFMLFALGTFLTSVVFMQAFSALPMHMMDIGFTKRQIGWLMSANGVLIVVCQVPLTHLLSRFDRILVIVAGEVLLLLGFGLTTFATAWPMFLATILIWTLGEVVQAAFKQTVVADFAPVDMRARYMGVFSLCHAVALAVGSPAGCFILERWGPNVLWPLCAFILGLGAFAYWLVYVQIRRSECVTAHSEPSELDRLKPYRVPEPVLAAVGESEQSARGTMP